MSRLPIRLRLTFAFAGAVAVVLAATGSFVYLQQASALDQTVNQGLRARAADVTALAQQADNGLREGRQAAADPNGFAQVLTPAGRVVDATPGLPAHALLSPRELAALRPQGRLISYSLAGERVRLLAVRVHAQDRNRIVIVGTSLEPRLSALNDLRTELLIGGPIALLLVSLAGYLLAAAALRPVDRMGEQAATISAANPGQRLPLPAADDELARLGRRLNDMLTRLQAALERERSFVADASHELRTPLALLKTELELALDEPQSIQALQSAVRSAGEETDRLSQLAEDLLLLSQADARTMPIRRSRVVVADMLTAVAARYRRRADDAGRAIDIDGPPGLSVLADRLRLEQALANLVDNALRHGAGTVRLRAAEASHTIEVHVTDEGGGFPAEFLAHAFERFSRPDQARSRGGAGLGLAIVNAIMSAHGGSATAANQPRGGGDVTLTLPLDAARSPSRAAGETDKPIISTPG
jgi:two-component system OmpR family sensor kinase